MKHRFARLMISGVCLSLVAGAFTPAFGQTSSSLEAKRAEATRLQQQIDANGEKISALAERYDQARLDLDTATKHIDQVQSRVNSIQAESQRIARMVAGRAATIYMSAGAQSPIDSLDASGVRDLGVRSKYAESTADRDSQLLNTYRATRADLASAEGK